MNIKIPTKFNEILKDDYRSLVDSALSRFKDIYIDNKVEFFQAYTDHGLTHIEEVLETAANIIDDDSFKLLNEKDIAVLIISILLHDIGMHITAEGVAKILDTDFDKWRIAEFDNKSWKEEWINYFQEAKRFNDEQLMNIFGTVDQNIMEPDLNSLSDYDRKLYGEFLRRFHHRLAHEIAHSGFPTKIDNENITIQDSGIEKDIIDISGLVARSHGMPIRKAIDYLEIKFSDAWRTPYGVKTVFLMVVLRIADYLQIHSDRASKITIKSKRLDSPISKREWEKHQSVKDINIKTADPERIFVIAKPDNSLIYLELEQLFKDIQSELDISWAILGEAYGKDEELKKLKLKYRRLRSTLDDEVAFNKTIDYIPERIFFNADPALLKLLIGPLYGEDPRYGVRELLQNSVDAVKEREYLTDKLGKIRLTIQPVKTGKPRYELIIEDSGVGMSKDTIINYFFKAGASFRKSMAWKKNFVDDDEVKIQRTGRFGVGVLAVFLLGDEFEMWTKYDSVDSTGYYCKAALGTTQVELIKDDCATGTKLKIQLKDSVNDIINKKIADLQNSGVRRSNYYGQKFQLLDWFTWYVMDKPTIELEIEESLAKIFRVNNSTLLISSKADVPSKNWRFFSTNDYKGIHWTLNLKEPSQYFYNDDDRLIKVHNKLACNGFKIDKKYKIQNKSYGWIEPKISVFDNAGNFPLSLNRDYIQDDHLPFEDELLEAIGLEIISALLKTEFSQIGPYYVPKSNIITFLGEIDISKYIIVIGDEYTLLHQSLFSFLKIKSFDQVWFRQQSNVEDYNLIPKSAYQAIKIVADPINFYKPILESNSWLNSQIFNWFGLGSNSGLTPPPRNDKFSRKYISTAKFKYLNEGKRLSTTFKTNVKANHFQHDWTEIISNKEYLESTQIDIQAINSHSYPLVIENFVNESLEKDSFFVKTWEKYLNKEWTFPIDKTKRPELRLNKINKEHSR
jgi:molecular chaperone HtpG